MAGKVDIAKLAERLAQLNQSEGGNKSGMQFINIKDGRNVIRVLPPAPGKDMFAEEVFVHYGVGKSAENKNGTMVVCPKTHGEDKPCPICELSQELRSLSKRKDDSYDKQAKSLYRRKRVYYNAIDRSGDLSVYEKNEEGKWINKETGEEESPVKVMGTGIGIYKDILGLIVDPEYGDITDPEEGLDLIITKTGSGQFGTKYDVKTVRKESPIGFDYWEECLHDLSQLTVAKSYDDLLTLLQGEKHLDDNEEDASDNEDDNEDDNEENEDKRDTTDNEEDDLQAEIQAALQRRRQRK